MLVDTADTIAEHFPDYEHSPFVQEKFHEDWSHDQTWGWQQNRAVVGHNLKIAWNLMRINSIAAEAPSTSRSPSKIAGRCRAVGSDQQRGGWYDVVERDARARGDDPPLRLARPQGLVAAGAGDPGLPDPGRHRSATTAYRKLARESAAFYNAFFLDHDDGAVYFNVLANGMPYLLGTERLKGSHSMSGYHSIELCYLAAVYTNLLITKQPLDLYFKPAARRVARTTSCASRRTSCPPGSIRIEQVWIDGQRHTRLRRRRRSPSSCRRPTSTCGCGCGSPRPSWRRRSPWRPTWRARRRR